MESWKNAHVRVHKASEEIRQLQLPSSGAGFLYTSVTVCLHTDFSSSAVSNVAFSIAKLLMFLSLCVG